MGVARYIGLKRIFPQSVLGGVESAIHLLGLRNHVPEEAYNVLATGARYQEGQLHELTALAHLADGQAHAALLRTVATDGEITPEFVASFFTARDARYIADNCQFVHGELTGQQDILSRLISMPYTVCVATDTITHGLEALKFPSILKKLTR